MILCPDGPNLRGRQRGRVPGHGVQGHQQAAGGHHYIHIYIYIYSERERERERERDFLTGAEMGNFR